MKNQDLVFKLYIILKWKAYNIYYKSSLKSANEESIPVSLKEEKKSKGDMCVIAFNER